MQPIYRVIPQGCRMVGSHCVQSGHRLERLDLEYKKPTWIYVDTLPPDMECVRSFVRNVQGILALHGSRTGPYIP